MESPSKWICTDCMRGYEDDPNRTRGHCICGSLRTVLRSVAVDVFGAEEVAKQEAEAKAVRLRGSQRRRGMNVKEAADHFKGANPTWLADGRLGVMIRIGATEAGVQVPGEEDIRWIPWDRLRVDGDGAFTESGESETRKGDEG